MDPEQRLFVIHKYLAVKFLVILIGTFTWIFGPERIGIVEWYRTFYNLYLVLGRRNFYDFFFALVVFFFLSLGLFVDFFNYFIGIFYIFLVDRFIFLRGIGLGKIDLGWHERTVFFNDFSCTVFVGKFQTILI